MTDLTDGNSFRGQHLHADVVIYTGINQGAVRFFVKIS